eukprot:6259773-Pyramimonas_sp.AAC.1
MTKRCDGRGGHPISISLCDVPPSPSLLLTKDLEARAVGIEESRDLIHEAELIEVELTDKLLKLDDILDEFETAEGRKAVQAQVITA